MHTIDGALGEGGGQILRTALALALCRGEPVRIERVRAGRPRPGLARQHLAAVQAARAVGGARVEGAEIGSTRLTFVPGPVRPGRYDFDVGSAGSAVLVLQTVLPALLTAAGPSEVAVTGGTHNHNAPPYPFLAGVFLPLVARLGPALVPRLERPGFYPRGGGRLSAGITPVPHLAPFTLEQRGPLEAVTATALVADLPRHIGERELRAVADALRLPPEALTLEEAPPGTGPGNAVWVTVASALAAEVCTGFGRRGVRAEDVAAGAAGEARRYLDCAAPVGAHLADQLLVPLAAGAGGTFVTRAPPSRHLRTNAAVIERVTGAPVALEPGADGTLRVTVRPA